MAKSYLFLALAIICEIIGTSCLKSSEGFTKLLPAAIVVISYCAAFYFLSLTLNKIPIGIAYAIWSGAGIVLIAVIGVFIFKQTLDLGAIVGLILIVSGVAIINLFSKTIAH
ncbi:MAG: QacE family quaternary ammonium compound efflux SMR transporter [Helicobacteraceae bacterium]|jgi:small multidrug resistance pump|nr:QacE family quaternary ammonium compound efflux SMR transporter [Helicobacteraceae bacterium]